MKINISGVFPPTQKQKAVGIHGAASVELVSDESFVVARLSGITVRESKAGNKFLSMPSFKITGKDGGDDKWLKHFNLFPLGEDADYNNSQKESLSKLTQEILRLLEEKKSSYNDTRNNNPQDKQVSTSSPQKEAEPWG
jgi:hypothetical protein